MNEYDDIIGLEHPTSKVHPRMSMRDRAAQFAPFAALTGHSAMLRETARLTDSKILLDDCAIEELNERLCRIAREAESGNIYSLTFFLPDKQKSGGSYVTVTDSIKSIDACEKTVVTSNGNVIPINNIIYISDPECGNTD